MAAIAAVLLVWHAGDCKWVNEIFSRIPRSPQVLNAFYHRHWWGGTRRLSLTETLLNYKLGRRSQWNRSFAVPPFFLCPPVREKTARTFNIVTSCHSVHSPITCLLTLLDQCYYARLFLSLRVYQKMVCALAEHEYSHTCVPPLPTRSHSAPSVSIDV